MTQSQKKMLEELKAMEEKEMQVVDEFEGFEEIETIIPNIIFDEEFKIKVQKGEEWLYLELKVTLTDVDFFLVKDIQNSFENIASGNMDFEPLNEFLNECVAMKNHETGEIFIPQTTKEKFMFVTTIMKKITPSLYKAGNRQQRRAFEKANRNNK